jgi:hypothetical protein
VCHLAPLFPLCSLFASLMADVTLASSTARAQLRHFGATWMRAECGLGRRADIEPEAATYDVGVNPLTGVAKRLVNCGHLRGPRLRGKKSPAPSGSVRRGQKLRQADDAESRQTGAPRRRFKDFTLKTANALDNDRSKFSEAGSFLVTWSA